jgi:hypothetical protein
VSIPLALFELLMKIPLIMATKSKKKVGDGGAFSSIANALDSASKTLTASIPQASIKKATQGFTQSFQDGVYNSSYGFSYGLIYSGVFLTELLPEDSTIRRGFEEGADAAFQARAHVQAKKKNMKVKAKVEEAEIVEEVVSKPKKKAKAKVEKEAPVTVTEEK